MTHLKEQQSDIYSIYRFTDPRDKEIIYIGLTNNPDRRYKQHTGKSGLLYPLAQELAQEGLKLLFDVIETIKGIENAFQLEKKYIQQYKPLLNIINNSIAVNERKAAEQYAKEIDELMKDHGFTYEQAVIWHHEFSTSEGDWYAYQTISNTIQATKKYLQIGRELSQSEILEIALEVTGFHKRMASLRKRGGVDSE